MLTSVRRTYKGSVFVQTTISDMSPRVYEQYYLFLTKHVVEVDAEDLLKILLSNEEHENYPREKLKCNKKLDAIDFGSVVLVTIRNGWHCDILNNGYDKPVSSITLRDANGGTVQP
uniref:Tudor domain-containing protein n=1 Tax=Parascaris univalens TaxID=6257 RepID=A0A915ABT1_PARUN